ncbi:MAG: twin-arginine translocation signal domain-containing protein [Bacteroidetes bacterium]|nr:MAG: twin-arginine translocation signal domain-containing protein [Bacteroidota bacterium]
MDSKDFKTTANRRNFLGTLAAGAAAGIASIAPSIESFAADEPSISSPPFDDPEEMFKKISGKHRIVFDSPHPHEIYPFAWPRVFLLTNEATNSGGKDCSVVVVLRHSSIGYAMEDRLWEKYQLGKMFEANDPETKQPATRNPFWKPKPGAYKIPGVGELLIGVDQLQSSGVMFCVCAAAINVYSAAAAAAMNLKHEDVKKDFMSGLLPGIQPVPSGVWALGRAQDHGCGYIFAG